MPAIRPDLAPKPYRLDSILLLILGIALMLRVFNYQAMQSHNPIFNGPIVDSQEYLNDARFYLKKNWWGTQNPYFHPPLYTYFVASVFAVMGESLPKLRVAQILLDVFNVWLIFLLARRFFSPTVARGAALAYAFYIPMIFFSVEILPPVFINTLLLSFLLVLFRGFQPGKTHEKYFAFSGFLAGLLMITFPTFALTLLWTGIAFFFFYPDPQMSRSARLKRVALFGLGIAIPIAGVMLRNILMSGEWVPISRNGGINFYLGNNPDMDKTVGLHPGFEWDQLYFRPYLEKRIDSNQALDRYWYAATLDFIRSRPLTWIGLLAKKAMLFLNAHEFPRNFDFNYFRNFSWVTRLPVLNYGWSILLGLTGMIWLWFQHRQLNRPRELLLLFGFALSYALAVVLFFVSDRYRLPIIPLVLIAGSFAVVEGYQHIQTRRWSALLTPALFVTLLTPIVVLPFWRATYPYRIGENFTAAQIANSLLMQAQQERLLEKRQRLLRHAMAELERAERQGSPDALYEIYHMKALLELEQGQLEPSMASLQKAHALQPQHIYTITLLGKLYLHQGKMESALAMLQNGIKIFPSYPDLYIYSAQVYLKQNQPDKAVQALEAYDLNCPSPNPWVYRMLGDLYFQKGNWTQAADRYRLAIAHPQGREIEPQHYVKWANCFIMLRDYRRSLAIYQDAASRFPHDVQIQNNLRQLRQAVR